MNEKPTAGELLKKTVCLFEDAGILDPETDAWLLFENAFSTDRTAFLLDRGRRPDPGQVRIFGEYTEERLSGKPVQYILGEAWFCGYRFRVNPDVLIPRYDTELLVEEAKKAARPGMKVLDLCTGSGCVIITLQLESGIEGTGTDISEAALDAARSNNGELGAECAFLKSDIFDNVRGKYDMIVSNPPYIRSADIDGLQKEVRDFEPRLALDGGHDGLDLYKRIASDAPEHLKEKGRIILEIGHDQAEDVQKILEVNGFTDIIVVKDLSGHDRVVRAVKA